MRVWMHAQVNMNVCDVGGVEVLTYAEAGASVIHRVKGMYVKRFVEKVCPFESVEVWSEVCRFEMLVVACGLCEARGEGYEA